MQNTKKYVPLHSPDTGVQLPKYDSKELQEIISIEAWKGILRGYIADPSQIKLYPIDPKDICKDTYQDLFTIMNIFSNRDIKKINKARIAAILEEKDLPIHSTAPSTRTELKNVLNAFIDAVKLDPTGAVENLPAYYNLENKYYTLRELYKRGANIIDFFIPSSASGIDHEAELREQARKNLENNTAEEIRAIVLDNIG